jgi:hypothetical protein
MDLTEELDPFVLDFLLDRGWLTGCDLCRVAQASKIFGGEPYEEAGIEACRVAHAARRRLTDWLGLRPTSTESHLGLLVLVERSLELAAAQVPRGVVLYLWTQEARDGAAPDAEHTTAPPALPLRAPGADTSADTAPDAAEILLAPRPTDAVLLDGAQLIQSAADGTTGGGAAVPGFAGARVRLPGEANAPEVATVGEALNACLSAAERVQSATRGSPCAQLFEARLTGLANFLKDVGLHALGETALKWLPSIRHFLEEEARLQQPSTSDRLFSWMRGLRASDEEEVNTKGEATEDPEQSERDAVQLVMSLSSLSSSMVSRFYAQTYVQANDTESGEALGLADAAVRICRERLEGNGSLLVRAATLDLDRSRCATLYVLDSRIAAHVAGGSTAPLRRRCSLLRSGQGSGNDGEGSGIRNTTGGRDLCCW